VSKRVWIIGGAIVLVIAVAAVFYFAHPASAAIGNLNIYGGSVSIVRGNGTVQGATGAEIYLDDEISVAPGSRVSIILKDGTEVRLEAGTKITVSDITYNGQKLSSAVFDLQSGKAWSHVQPVAQGGSFKVETPTVVATVRGTNFGVSYDGTESDIYVATHAVEVALRSDPQDFQTVPAGYAITIHDATAAADLAAGPQPSAPTDDWTLFNEQLDASVEPDILPAAPSSSPPANTTTSPTPPPPPPPPKPKPTSTQPSPSSSPPFTLSLNAENPAPSQNDIDPLTVIATYPNGSTTNVTTQVAWTLSPALDIVDTQGNLHCAFSGPVSIVASLNGVKSNEISITVAEAQPTPAPTLTSIGVACEKSSPTSISMTGYQSVSAQCTATAFYSDGSTNDVTTKAQWSATGTAGGSINSTGYYQPEMAEGQETISATLNNVVGSTTISIP
jgi:FecR protein